MCDDVVQVALRIRPLVQSEIDRACEDCIEVMPGHPHVQISNLAFTYNHVFPQHITQLEFYDTSVRGLLGKLFEGYNVTILAYGQTSSGKSYTMGTNYSGPVGDSSKLGVIPQAVGDIFSYIETHKDKFVFRVTVSFLELYQERCYDLLSGKERALSVVEIREDVNRGVVLPGMSEVPVTSTAETMALLARGSRVRVTGATAMNRTSSRSHAVFTIVIAKESLTDKNIATKSKFHLVDLAGSERINKTKASGQRLKESVKINQGLLALGNVISALGEGTNRSFINYRDSKLTRLLRDSLGGNSLTLMVACVSPADYNLGETVSTLRYADRARRIRNKPVINQDGAAAENARSNNLANEPVQPAPHTARELNKQLQEELDRERANYAELMQNHKDVSKLLSDMIEENTNLRETALLPPTTREENELLQEELDRERANYAELMDNHNDVKKYLSDMIEENTNLCEKALLAEAAKDNLDCQLKELTEYCKITIDRLNTGDKQTVKHLRDIMARLENLQVTQEHNAEELADLSVNVAGAYSVEFRDAPATSEDQAAAMEGQVAAMHGALSSELRDLEHCISLKADDLRDLLLHSGPQPLDALLAARQQVARLERERDELVQEVARVQANDAAPVKRSDLEIEIECLNHKCQNQTHVIQALEDDMAKTAAISAELQALKTAKVNIVRQMRTESERFRKWKLDNEREILRLRNEDHKRAADMAKMESLHAKQQSVLKRKMEEAVAVNRRLKEALDKQNQTRLRRSARGSEVASFVQQYVEQELEVHLSIMGAERSLEELMVYRGFITKQIRELRERTDTEANRETLAGLEADLATRKAQIADLQQRILAADHDRPQWDVVQTMFEAKVALKFLFDQLVESNRRSQLQIDKHLARHERTAEALDRLRAHFRATKAKHTRKFVKIKSDNEEVIQGLIRRLERVEAENDRLTVPPSPAAAAASPGATSRH